MKGTLLPTVLLGVIGAVGSFVLTTVLMDRVPDTLLAAAGPVGAFAFAAAFGGASVAISVRSAAAPASRMAMAGGILSLWLAPLFALAQRATDSPSGSDAMMLMTAIWGVLAVLAAFASSDRTPLAALAGVLAAASGAAALLANWERPSSFNLFVKATERELMIVLAGAVFAVGAVLLSRAVVAAGVKRTAVLATGAAAAAGILGTLLDLPALFTLSRGSLAALGLLGVSTGLFALSWLALSHSAGIPAAASTLLLAPAGATALQLIERATGVYGPTPVVWPGALAGIAVSVAGVVVVLANPEVGRSRTRRGPLSMGLAVLGGIAVAAGLVALVTPTVEATSVGTLSGGFRATWKMLGFETAVGWVTLTASMLAASSALLHRGCASRARTVVTAAASLVPLAAIVPLAPTPLHTWTTWIPADVQQTYGTEYARLTTEALTNPFAAASAALAAATALLVILTSLNNAANEAHATTGATVVKEGK